MTMPLAASPLTFCPPSCTAWAAETLRWYRRPSGTCQSTLCSAKVSHPPSAHLLPWGWGGTAGPQPSDLSSPTEHAAVLLHRAFLVGMYGQIDTSTQISEALKILHMEAVM